MSNPEVSATVGQFRREFLAAVQRLRPQLFEPEFQRRAKEAFDAPHRYARDVQLRAVFASANAEPLQLHELHPHLSEASQCHLKQANAVVNRWKEQGLISWAVGPTQLS